MPKTDLRSVPDTNVLLASELSAGPTSPNREFFDRWKSDEFFVLYSWDTLREYIAKLRGKNIFERFNRVSKCLAQNV